MRELARSLAVAAAFGLAVGPAFGQGAPIVVGDAPIHAVPKDDAAPVELDAPPNTLNAQLAAMSTPAPAPAAQSQAEGPTVDIAPRIINAAGAFAAYMKKAGAIDAKFADGSAVAKGVLTGAAYEGAQFQEGMVAYAALAALQEQGFVQAVYDAGRDRRDREELARLLFSDPKAVLEIEGAREAGAAVGEILGHMGADLVKSGQGVKQAAYDVQKQAWSKEAAPDPQQRLAQTKALSAVKIELKGDEAQSLIQNVVALRKAREGVGGRRAEPTAVVVRALAVAALAVLGEAGDENAEKLGALLTEAKSADCMKMAKLNLYQCLAVAGPHYEHVYCLGQHAIMDTGQCVVSSAGQSLAPAGALQKASAPTAAPSRSIAVPFALATPAGPERSRAYARPQPGAPEPARAPEPAPEPTPAPEQYAVNAPQAYRDERADEPEAVATRESARDDAWDRYEQEQERYMAERDRYERRYAPRDRWDYPQDYDPYDSRSQPPGYAYRYRR